MNSRKVYFHNMSGDKLAGHLELPADGNARTFVIFAHCFTCGKNLKAAHNISRALSNNGLGVLRLDFTGLGESEGEFEDTNFTTNIEDLIAASNFLKKEYIEPKLIIGHSLGGAAAIRAAAELNFIKAVVTIGAPGDTEHLKNLFHDKLEQIKDSGKAIIDIGERPLYITRQFINDLEKHELKDSLQRLKAALLILHSPQDEIVSIDNARQIYEAAIHPKSFVSLDQADHLLSKKGDAYYVAHIIATWAMRYLELPDEDHDLASEKQVETKTGDDGYTTLIKAGYHRFIADEPKSLGGKNLGPTPYDLLVASLGACTGITLRMYADRKKWPLEEIKVHLHHEKRHAEDCGTCEGGTSKMDYISREIELIGNLDDKQRKRLMEIANKCPVHKTLEGDINVETSMVKKMP